MTDTVSNLPATRSWPLRLQEGFAAEIHGREYVLAKWDGEVLEFTQTSRPYRDLAVGEAEFRRMLEDGEAEVGARRLDRDAAAFRKAARHVALRDLPPKQQERCMFLHLLCQEFDGMKVARQHGRLDRKVNLGKACLDWFLPEAKERIVKAHNKPSQSFTKDDLFGGKTPSARQFSRLYAKHVAYGGSPAAFAPNFRGTPTRARRGDPLERRIRDRFQKGYASPKEPSMADQYGKYWRMLERLNRSGPRKSGKLPKLVTVHRCTFEEGIKKLDQFHVVAARKGEKFALARYRVGSGGHRPTKPLERVEIDEWQVDLITLLIEVNVWETLTVKEKAAVERSRLWCTAAIDVASRCVLAAKLHDRDPCGDTAVEVLELAMGDKSRLADQANAAAAWAYGGKIEALFSDNGSAFRSAKFMTTAFDAGVEIVRPQAGQAQRRPHIERFFGTLSTQFLHWYHGRTFSDYLRKGDHDPQKEATVCADLFAKGFLRQLIDVYHHTPHSELGGQTPHTAWMRLARKHGVPPEPGPRHMRRVFGLDFRRKVDKRGLRFMALQYNSPEVQEHFGKEVRLRVGRFDLSEVSFWNGRTWVDVPATLDVPRGMTMYEWAYVGGLHEAEFAGDREIHLDWALEAMNEVRRNGELADLMHGIDPLWSRVDDRAWADRMDRERFHGVRVVAASEGHPGLLDLTGQTAAPAMGEHDFDPLPGWEDGVMAAEHDRYDFPSDEDDGADGDVPDVAADFDDGWPGDDSEDEDDDGVEIGIE